jgi:hypothetical protein
VWRRPRVLSALTAGVAAVAVLIGLSAAVSYAQGQGTAGTTTTTSNEPAFIKNLHITGFYQNTTATWLNSSNASRGFGSTTKGNVDRFGALSKNSLSSERQLLQIDVNDDFTENDSMFLRSWFVYEPSYPWEVHCLGPGAAWPGGAEGVVTAGKVVPPAGPMDCNSDFYNDYGIREMWFKHRWGPLQFFVGRQIVTWGESLAFRVGDEINPQDLSWSFGFNNLEQSRTPIWMIHPILNLPSAGPFSSNFLELVYVPGFDFLYTHVDYSTDSNDGLDQIAGRVNIGAANTGGRFAGQLDCRFLFSFLGASVIPAVGLPGSCGTGTPIAQFQTATGYPGQGPGEYIALTDTAIPNATWGNSEIGVRLHTLVYNTEMTAFWLMNNEVNPVLKVTPLIVPAGPGTFLREEKSIFPQYQSFGMTGNRPIYLPGSLAQLPFVIRAEVWYKNHQFFDTRDLPGDYFVHFNPFAGTPNGLYKSDTIKWLFAMDLDSAYTPWLTSTGNLTVNYELTGTTILSYQGQILNGATFFANAYRNDINMLLSVSTSWWWGAISPDWTNIYAPQGQTWLLFPTLQLTPPWTNKYFTTLGYVGILGSDRYNLDGGLYKGKSMFTFRFQYNFSLL